MSDELRIKLLPKQKEFVLAQERRVLYSGAWGAGKTRALCVKNVVRACNPGAREGLFRFELAQLKKTTLVTLLEGDGKMGPVLPEGTYTHNKSDRSIYIHGGGQILYGDLENMHKIGSMNLTGAGVDEALEVSEDRWRALGGRIRVPVDGLPNQLYAACNPGGPHHHLAKQFGLSLDHVAQPGCRAIRTNTAENSHLPADYIADLQTMSGVALKRYFSGLWVAADGLVYELWDPEIHARTPHAWAPVRRIIGVDEGTSNPFAALCMDVDGDGRAHVAAEVYRPRLLIKDKIDAVRALIATEPKIPAECVVVDPSATDLIQEFRAVGLHVVEANNEVLPGINRVAQRLAPAFDGRPRLMVAPDCRKTHAEFETYEWAKNPGGETVKDKPQKANDHAMDALRYAVARLDGSSPIVCVGTGTDTPVEGPAAPAEHEFARRLREFAAGGMD